jgi:hypothetical protein
MAWGRALDVDNEQVSFIIILSKVSRIRLRSGRGRRAGGVNAPIAALGDLRRRFHLIHLFPSLLLCTTGLTFCSSAYQFARRHLRKHIQRSRYCKTWIGSPNLPIRHLLQGGHRLLPRFRDISTVPFRRLRGRGMHLRLRGWAMVRRVGIAPSR